MKRAIIIFVISVVWAIQFLSAATPISFPGREAASVGIYIEELSSGKVLVDNNSAIAMTPASILKCLTAATTLISLGKDFQYTTDFYLIGQNPRKGIADLVIAGSADPSMGGRDFAASASLPNIITDQLSELGINNISGEIRLDSSILPEGGGVIPGWEVEDITESYGAGLFPINWMDNYFESDYIIANPGDFFIEDIAGACARKGIEIINNPEYEEKNMATDTDSILFTSQEIDSDTLLVYRHRSERLEEIISVMMEKSINLIAEGCLRATAPYTSVDTAIAREKVLWKSLGVNLDRTRILDGSGLARGNAISPKQMAGILGYMAKSEHCNTYTRLFPKAGLKGTVKNLLAGTRLAGRLAIKSGSMGGVHCYAGYLLNVNDQPTHTVVIMINNFFCPRTQLRKSIERYLLETLP